MLFFKKCCTFALVFREHESFLLKRLSRTSTSKGMKSKPIVLTNKKIEE